MITGKWTACFLDRTSCLIQLNGIDSESVPINSADCKFCFAISVEFLMFRTPRKHGSLQYMVARRRITINKGSERKLGEGCGSTDCAHLCVRIVPHPGVE